jgi:hypothetical protein
MQLSPPLNKARRRPQATSRERTKAENAFGRLPYAVIRDPKISAAYLVLFAYRVTFIAFALNVTALLRNPIVRGGGLGRNVINALIAAMGGRI